MVGAGTVQAAALRAEARTLHRRRPRELDAEHLDAWTAFAAVVLPSLAGGPLADQLARMSMRQRQVCYLHDVRGLNVRTIGTLLGVSHTIIVRELGRAHTILAAGVGPLTHHQLAEAA